MSGAAGIVSSDFIEQKGLTVAELSADTEKELEKLFPDWMPVTNPIDLWPAVEIHGRLKAFEAALRVVSADPNVDAILIHIFLIQPVPREVISRFVDVAKDAGKMLFCWYMGQRSEAHRFQRYAQELGMPAFPELYRSVESMAAVFSRKRAVWNCTG
jgi:acetyltransferase